VTTTPGSPLRTAPDTFARREWPRAAWYAAAYDVEVGAHLLPRTVAGASLVLFRTPSGEARALENACWHRLLPLSEGRLLGDEVMCGYHGLRYDADGRCTFMPSQRTVNPSARVRSYPVVERHRFVWVWTGDLADADPATVPDLHWNDDPEWAGDGRLIHVDCNYKLIVDNLMDLTHETFVHGGSIGHRSVAESPFEVTHGKGTVTVTRWMIDVEAPPFWDRQLEWRGAPAGNVDRWQIIHFTPPGTIAIDVGVAPTGTGAPEGDRSAGVNGFVLNTMTPETDTSTHYFWAFARNYALTDQRITTLLRDGVSGVFAEDEEVLAAQQRAIDAHPDKEFYNLNIDGGAMWARRMIDLMLAAEDDSYAEAGARAERDIAEHDRRDPDAGAEREVARARAEAARDRAARSGS
jgi:phenylpropionate dioxygenase-like ring-hydroxylating dioxygenase large terminal subunit